jgi:hypothetical protein
MSDRLFEPGHTVTRAVVRLAATALVVLGAAMTAACDSGADPAAQQWLHGTWELTFNPDRDSEDDLVFDKDGSVQIHTANKRIIDGRYMVSDNELLMALIVNDKPVEVRFEISPDKSRLVYRNGAYYMKKGAATPAR